MLRSLLAIGVLILSCDSLSAATVYIDQLYNFSRLSGWVYGEGLLADGTTIALRLDVFRPTQLSVPVPVNALGIILLHGGAFGGLTKSSIDSRAQVFAKYGYNVFSIDYRPGEQLADQGNWIREIAQDAKAALRWVHDNAAQFNTDPERLGIGGYSDGATLSLYTAYNEVSPDIRPDVVLDFYGASLYYPIVQSGATAPPAFVTHGTADPTIPFSIGQDSVNKLNAAGIFNEFYAQPGVGHTVNLTMVTDGNTLLGHNMEFLYNHLVLAAPEPDSIALAAMGAAVLVCCAVRRKRSCDCA